MKKTLLLVLITLIQSQSDGVVLTGSNHPNKLDDNEKFQSEGWDNSESSSSSSSDISKVFHEKSQPYQKRSGNDVLTRRSILDKTFMRFGRTNEHNCLQKSCRTVRSSYYEPDDFNFQRDDRGMTDSFIRFGRRAPDNFIRFGRRAPDNFIRFGRRAPDNFIRFGRRAPDNFIRFGRRAPDNFIRFGRRAPDNFIRFGRRAPDNFIRFGRDGPDVYYPIDPEDFERVAKRLRDSAFIRFGRNDLDSFIRFGKLDQNFIRFGRGNLKPQTGHDNYEGMPEKAETAFVGYGHKTNNPVTGSGYSTESNNVVNFAVQKERQGQGEDGREGSEDKESDFGDINRDVHSDVVIRRKRKTEESRDNEEVWKEMTGKIPEVSEDRDSSKFRVLNRRSTGYLVEKIPGFFPQNFPPRLQSYANSWEDLENSRNYDYTGSNPPYFPVSSNF